MACVFQFWWIISCVLLSHILFRIGWEHRGYGFLRMTLFLCSLRYIFILFYLRSRLYSKLMIHSVNDKIISDKWIQTETVWKWNFRYNLIKLLSSHWIAPHLLHIEFAHIAFNIIIIFFREREKKAAKKAPSNPRLWRVYCYHKMKINLRCINASSTKWLTFNAFNGFAGLNWKWVVRMSY